MAIKDMEYVKSPYKGKRLGASIRLGIFRNRKWTSVVIDRSGVLTTAPVREEIAKFIATGDAWDFAESIKDRLLSQIVIKIEG